jgi:hypothetical protein
MVAGGFVVKLTDTLDVPPEFEEFEVFEVFDPFVVVPLHPMKHPDIAKRTHVARILELPAGYIFPIISSAFAAGI